VLVIVNPTAGAQRRRKLAVVLKELEKLGCVVTLWATQARGDAEAMARAADPVAFDLVAVAGGDGTINEAINGLADSKLPLALIPLGTANVLANELALPRHAAGIAQTIAAGTPRPIYPGEVGNRRFAMMLGIGVDARIVAAVDLRLKRRAGKIAYVVSGIRAMLNYRPVQYAVTIDGHAYHAAHVIVAKGHLYAGRFVVARAARLDAPSLHVVLMERPGRWNILRYGLAIAFGRLEALRDVRIVACRAVFIDGPAGEFAQADGDLAGILPTTIKVADRPLFLIQP
jgi:YegS/Rv2252/BmrU family lipid kinase